VRSFPRQSRRNFNNSLQLAAVRAGLRPVSDAWELELLGVPASAIDRLNAFPPTGSTNAAAQPGQAVSGGRAIRATAKE
jgi:hypothetical protein